MTVFFTDEQLDYLDRLEQMWRESLPSYSLRELLQIFPTGKGAAKRAINAQIKEIKASINSLNDFRDLWYKELVNKAKPKEQPKLIAWLDERVARYLAGYETDLKRLKFQLNTVENVGNTEPVIARDGVTDEQIEQAKATPINTLIEVNRTKKAKCLWHTDKNPSMHVYPDHVYCYACGKAADAIDIYIALNGCDFKTAVRAMTV